MLQSLNHVHGPLLDLLQYVAISVVLGSSALDPTVQMCLTRAEGKDHLPQPVGDTLLNTAQDIFQIGTQMC